MANYNHWCGVGKHYWRKEYKLEAGAKIPLADKTCLEHEVKAKVESKVEVKK